MADVLALIPARAGSKGIPNKNFRPLAGIPPLARAIEAARSAGCRSIVVSTEANGTVVNGDIVLLPRPAELAQDDTPMIDVVNHALGEIPGPPEQIILLVQPTQPLRTPAHLRAAIDLLEQSGADSVVSVVELPVTHSPDVVCRVTSFPDGRQQLERWPWESEDGYSLRPWATLATRRQDVEPSFMRDGTCYAFYRRTVERYGNIYGQDVRPLIIDPSETCPLDSELDWQNAERRLRALS